MSSECISRDYSGSGESVPEVNIDIIMPLDKIDPASIEQDSIVASSNSHSELLD